MQDSSKYLIHADITTDGVIERSDVVGAIFGQTEGLLGDELDLRDLQQSSKVGRIDVEVDSDAGRSSGSITIATSLDKVATAILAAALETIERVGPCRSYVEISKIEDVRAAKRREIVERAKDLLAASFDEMSLSSREIIEEVRQSVRVADITDFEGFPAGPRVADSDAIIVVEGRADVITLLKYGVKNAVAVEGTNVPDEIAELTQDRTVTTFLDGDRGGDLILKELAQVGDVDYVALAPEDRSVEDLSRHEIMRALRKKVPYEVIAEGDAASVAATDGSATPSPDDPVPDAIQEREPLLETDVDIDTVLETDPVAEPEDPEPTVPATLKGHVNAVIGESTGTARLLDAAFDILAEVPEPEVFDAIKDADSAPYAVVVDGECSQRVLDVAAQTGVEHVVAREHGEFTKQPASPRLRTGDQLLA